ncbi:MAG: cytochrome ubiquinol oxidase subunit I [Nitrospiraceae bacterium]
MASTLTLASTFSQLEPITFPLVGNSIAIGIVSLLHIALASLAVGFTVLAPICESMGLNKPFYTDLARTMTRFTLVTFTASAVLAVIMIELFIGLFPLTNSWLFNHFRFPIHLAIAAFLLQLFALYPYYHFWDAMRARSLRLHIAVGAGAAACMLAWVIILDGIGSSMLTPATGEARWSRLFNPTWIPLVMHRFVGNLVLAGYAIAGYAAWRLGQPAAHADEPYYLHLLRTGVMIGLISLLLQPFTGLLYGTTIQEAAPQAYDQLTRGPYQGLVYAQFSLIGLLFLGSYVLLRSARAKPARFLWEDGAFLAGAALMVTSVGNPNLRRLFLFFLVALTGWCLFAWGRPFIETEPRALRRRAARGISIALAVISLLTYLTMGTIRETARRPDTVRGMISLQDEARTPAADR